MKLRNLYHQNSFSDTRKGHKSGIIIQKDFRYQYLLKFSKNSKHIQWLHGSRYCQYAFPFTSQNESSSHLVRLLRLMPLEGDWSLSISPVKLEDEAEYQCQVLGAGGPATAIRSVSILQARRQKTFTSQIVDLQDKIFPFPSGPPNLSKQLFIY